MHAEYGQSILDASKIFGFVVLFSKVHNCVSAKVHFLG